MIVMREIRNNVGTNNVGTDNVGTDGTFTSFVGSVA
jgi:hypothetical protein